MWVGVVQNGTIPGRGIYATYPAFLTAPVQLKDAAAVPVAFALYGDAITLSPSSSSDTAVVRLMRSSSEICGVDNAWKGREKGNTFSLKFCGTCAASTTCQGSQAGSSTTTTGTHLELFQPSHCHGMAFFDIRIHSRLIVVDLFTQTK